MNSLHSTISTHLKGKHLSFENRVTIQVLHSQGQSLRQIARVIHCSPATIKNELEREQKALYHDKLFRYDAQTTQARYLDQRLNCGRKCDYLVKCRIRRFIPKGKYIKD